MSIHTKKHFATWARLLISGLLLVFVYTTVDFDNLVNTFKMLSLKVFASVAVLYALGQIISSMKWRILVKGVGLQRSVGEIVRAYFFGMFVNTFGLGTVGGDVARSLVLKPAKGQRTSALATSAVDRLHGLAVLLAIGAISALVFHPPGHGRLITIFAVPVLVLLCVGWWLGPKLITRFFSPEHKLAHIAHQIATAFPHKLSTVVTITVISVAFHCIQIMMHQVISLELNTGLSLGYLFAVVPIVNIASSLPLSVNGLGIREGMYVLLFAPMGVTQETAVAFGAIWILVVTAISALGGLSISASSKLEILRNNPQQSSA